MAVRVKICGLTNLADARAATKCGADALGFIFFPKSPRFITPEKAASIIAQLPPFVAKVGVFVNEASEYILEVVRQAGLDTIQLHGEETPEFSDRLRNRGTRVVKAFRIKDQSSLAPLKDFPADAILLDSYVPGQLGGTGAKFNWDLALQAQSFGLPVILAGGLDPSNVADAISKVMPFAVDVSSGVESAPGIKDLAKVREFITQARRVS